MKGTGIKRIGLVLGACAAAGLMLAGCSETKKTLGIGIKRPPDEFSVYSRAPLSLPPDYGLRPPEIGANRPNDVDPKAAAKSAMLKSASPEAARKAALAALDANPNYSPGLKAFLKRSGAVGLDPSIRATVNREHTQLAEEDKTFTDRILFLGTPTEYGTVVDPEKESQRIREKLALGRPITEGDTPIIKRKRRGLLEGLF
jgi:hypothetical protein